MFDAIFNAFQAFNQIGFLFGGLICLGLAALIVFATIQARQRCIRVQGRIVAVRCGGVVSGMKNQIAEAPPSDAAPLLPRKSFRAVFREDPTAALVGLLFASIVILVPLALFSGGAYFAWDYLHLKTSGIRTEAKVLGVETNSSGDGTTYSTTVIFKDAQGNSHEAKDRIGTSWQPPWKRGSSVVIFYDAVNPEHFIIDTFWHNMGLPFGLMGMGGGVLFFLAGWPSVRDRMKKSRESASPMPQKIGMMEAAGRYYYPVYEYTAQNGETIRANSTSGSNSLNDKIPGTPVMLLVNPDEPWEANPPQILLVSFLVLLFMIPATVFLYAAFFNSEFNIFTVVFALAFLAYGGLKFAKTIKPRDQWETPSGFKQRRREERRKKAENPSGYILSPEEFNERLEALNRYAMVLSPFMFLIAFGLLTGGFYLEQNMADFSAHAQKTRGEVVGMNSHSSSDSSSYYAVVEFSTPEGKKTNFEDSFGSNPPMYTAGDKVEVMYDPARPSRAKIDRGLFNNLPALACYGFGGLLLWGTFTCWRNARRRREG